MNRNLYLILCLFSFFQLAFGRQIPVIKGKVINEQNEVVSNASIYLKLEQSDAIIKTAITNDKGEYVIENFPKGKFKIEASAIAYQKSTTDIFEAKEQSIEIPLIILKSQSNTIEEVSVKAEVPLIQSTNGKLVMNVENSSISAGNNALEVLKRAPGVNVDKDDNISLMGQQGVNVTIDGRQTFMSGEQLATFLKSTDGSQIKSIELSTTRSAKDDAEGTAGIINIVMKKNRMEGFNGNIVMSAAQGKRFRGNTSMNLNYKKEGTTIFSNYSYTDNSQKNDLRLERIIPGISDNTVFDQDAYFENRDKTHSYKLGIEQMTSDRNTLLFQFNGSNNQELSDNFSHTLMGPTFGVIDSIQDALSGVDEVFDRYSFNLNNEFKIDKSGKKLTTDVDYSFFNTGALTDYKYITLLPDLSNKYNPEYEKSDSDVDIKIFATKLDYTQPLWKGLIETGLKYSNVNSANKIQFENLLNSSWSNNPMRSNTFDYTEQILAGYFDYATQIKKWGIKAGLRSEYTISDGKSITENKQVKRDYVDLFPSAALSYNMSENHVFSFSYARKVSRPNYRYLNPFEYYIDKRTYNKGNPYLNPQYTNGIALNYTLYKMFNIAVGHDMTNDAMVESVGQDSILKTTWITRENLGKQNTSYLNLTIPARIGKFWSMYNNITGIYMHFKGPIAGYDVDKGSSFVQANSSNTFKLSKQLSAELAMRYNTKFIYNVYVIQEKFNADLGVTYNFKNQRSSLKLAFTDIFHTNHNNVFLNFEEYNSKIYQYNDSQTVRLTFNYKFGNLKQSIRKIDNSSDEKSRAL